MLRYAGLNNQQEREMFKVRLQLKLIRPKLTVSRVPEQRVQVGRSLEYLSACLSTSPRMENL